VLYSHRAQTPVLHEGTEIDPRPTFGFLPKSQASFIHRLIPTEIGSLEFCASLPKAHGTETTSCDDRMHAAGQNSNSPPTCPQRDLFRQAGARTDRAFHMGNRTGAFTSWLNLQGPSDSFASNGIKVVADVNGDGIPDLLISGSDTLDIHLGVGGATYATPFSIGTGPSPGSILTENLHGQAAGLPDIVVPDWSGAVVTLLNLTK